MTDIARVTFHGHACVSIAAAGIEVVIDPFEHGGLGGAVTCPPLPDRFDLALATHAHADHAAFHTVPAARVLDTPGQHGPLHWSRWTVAHDGQGGRLRGGLVDAIRLRLSGCTLLHLGDIGERPVGDTLEWLCAEPTTLLVVPAGGWFTLGLDAALEIIRLVRPEYALVCHTRSDGVDLPQMRSNERLRARWTSHVETANPLELDGLRASAITTLWAPEHRQSG